MANRNAQDAYAAEHAITMKALEHLMDMVENAPAPDENTNWAHVGDMQRMRCAIAEAVELATNIFS